MWIMTGLLLLAGGALSASSIIVGKKPNAKELIDKLVPYQGWIGAVMFLYGVYWLITSFFPMVKMISVLPVTAIIAIMIIGCYLVLGFLLGFSLITKYALSKNEQAMAKGQEIRAKLAKVQGPLGIVAIVVGLYWILALNIFHILI
mgnify:FL=1